MTEWYYAIEGDQQGPIDETALRKMFLDGAIDGETLVWQERLPQWIAFYESGLVPDDTSAEPESGEDGNPGGTHQCVECDNTFHEDNVIEHQGRWICAGCKPVYFQRIRESGKVSSRGIGSGGAATISELVGETFRALRGRWLFAAGLHLLAMIVIFAGGIVPFLGFIVTLILMGPMYVGLYR